MLDAKAHYVRNLFSRVPLEYDFLLRWLSFGQDKSWRAFIVNKTKANPEGLMLDVATGTGLVAADLAGASHPGSLVVGVDLTLSMLQTAKRRLAARNLRDRTGFVLARAENLPFKDSCFESASISLALRNVSDASKTLQEMSRVTRQEGIVISLDFARPPNRIFQLLYYDYLLGIFPLAGRMVSRAWARTLSYLGRSILKSRTGEQIARLMEKQGLQDAKSVPLTMGIVCAVYGKKR